MSNLIDTEIGIIPSHWEVIPFNKALKVKGRVGWKGYKTSDLRNSGPVVVGGTNIKANLYLDFTQTTYLSREKYEESPEIMLQKGDVILVTRGNGIGDVGYYNGQFREATINPSLVILSQFIGDPRFLFYYLNSPQGRFQLLSIEGGTSIPALYQGHINTLLCPVPPIVEQENIVGVLSGIDEKIDLLHRQNKTLEQLAETLFRQWFVAETEESWEVTSLFESINLVGGGTPKTDRLEFWNGDIKWLAGGDIASSHKGFITSTEKTISELGLRNSSAKLLPQFSTVISARGTVGKYCLLSEPMTFSQSNYGITPKFENCFFFTYLLIAFSVDELQAAAYGSVFDTITTNTFKEHKIRLPEISDIQQFEKSVTPYFQKIKSNTQQIQTLTKLRDTLLPKLMSGEAKLMIN